MTRILLPGILAMAVDRRGLEHPCAVSARRLADLGRLDLSLRLSGHRPDQPAAGRRPPRAAWCWRALSSALICSLHRHADHGRIRPAGDPARRARVGHRLPGRRSCWTSTIFDRLRSARVVAGAADLHPRRAPSLDTAIFFTIAFSAALGVLEPAMTCPGPPSRCRCWALARWCRSGCRWPLADWCVKLALALVALVALPLIIARNERKGCVKCFDKHKICVTLTLIGNHLKGGDPVSRVILERGVGTVRGGCFLEGSPLGDRPLIGLET